MFKKTIILTFCSGIFCILRWMLSSATNVYVNKLVLALFLQSDALTHVAVEMAPTYGTHVGHIFFCKGGK